MNSDLLVIYILGGATIIFILALAVVWFFSRARQKVLKNNMEQQAKEIGFQKELLFNTVKTQEVERERIAKELHDEITSKRSVIHLNVHLIKQQTNGNADLAIITDRIETSLEQCIDRSRVMAHELLPQIFKKFGFHHALKELSHSINLTGVITLKIEGEHLIPASDYYNLLHIYRILQELTQNTLKYAKAKQAFITFEKKSDDTFEITYRDDGVGYETDQPVYGLGISNIKTRVALLNGNVNFYSRPNEGTLVTIKIPELLPVN